MTAATMGAVAAAGAVACAIAVGWRRPARAAGAGALAAAASALALALAWARGGGVVVDVPWLSLQGSRLHLSLDALAAPLAVFTTALAAPILFYTRAYLPHHLERRGRDPRDGAHFARLLLLFMAAMTLLLLAQDLLVLFVALELTALASFLLIGFDRDDPAARRAASVALVVTIGSSLLFLIGALRVAAEAGTTALPALRALAVEHGVSPITAACLVAGLLGKSAQAPLHFWLPQAMVAPTPVSAYLHSAALVAAGVFVLARLRFLLVAAPEVLTALAVVGAVSIAVGGAMALVADELKRVLACSTIAQLGYVTLLIGLGGEAGTGGAPFAIVAHGLCKCALFLTAGAVTVATGVERLSEARGLRRSMPALAVAAAVAAAGLAGLPGTVGYFKDELLLEAAGRRGPAWSAAATAAIALTLAYTLRFWLRLFGGRAPADGRARPSRTLVLPVAALAVLVVLGGVWTAPLAGAFGPAAAVVADEAGVGSALAHHLELRAPPVPALAAWAAGVALALAVSRRRVEDALRRAVAAVSAVVGPAGWGDRLAAGAAALSGALHRREVRDLRDRIGAVLIPTAALVALGLVGHGVLPMHPGELAGEDLPLVAALGLTAIAAVAAVRAPGHLALVLGISFVGFSLALSFALVGAPDVALVLVLIETTTTLLFLALIFELRSGVLERAREAAERDRGPWTGIAAGAVAFLVAWVSFDAPPADAVAQEMVRLSEAAHALDVVTAILADFRGFDTAGELTVLAVAVFGAVGIHWGREA